MKYRTALAAVADLEVRVLLTVGRQTDLHAIGPPPANAHVEAWVPQAEILSTAAVVVAHGGSETTFGAPAAGVPLVLVPLFADQPVNAERVAATGAALVVAPDRGPADGIVALTRDDAPRLGAAIEAALSEPSYRRAASRIADEVRAYPSVDDLLAALAAAHRAAAN